MSGRSGIVPRNDQLRFEPDFNFPRLIACYPSSDPIKAGFLTYINYLSALFGLPVEATAKQSLYNFNILRDETHPNYDLVIWQEPRRSWIKNLLFGSAPQHALDHISTSLLVARQARWPLRHLLLIIRSEAVHSLAVNWTIRLANLSQAIITVLVLVPQKFSPGSRETQPQPLLNLKSPGDSLLERQISYVSQRLTYEGLAASASWQLGSGSPEQQIRAEFNRRTYDLVIVAAETKDWWSRRLIGESVEPVLRQANCPVLIAKPF